MKYAYEDLSDHQFEQLVECICQDVLGLAVMGFAPGPDGGRDARFEGDADEYPSRTSPWSGKTVIQAKHTNGINKSFSESDFFSAESQATIVGEELPKIKKLKDDGELENYMLFANRKLTAQAEQNIRNEIVSSCGIDSQRIALIGVEKLEMLLKRFPGAAERACLDPLDSPLIIAPEDLASVVVAFAENKDQVKRDIDDALAERTSYAEKNEANITSEEYAKTLRRRYLKDTATIKEFLGRPENEEVRETYIAAADEIELKIVSKRESFQNFDSVLEYVMDLLVKRDPDLRANKRLTRTLLFYMYWNCDIGTTDAEADETL